MLRAGLFEACVSRSPQSLCCPLRCMTDLLPPPLERGTAGPTTHLGRSDGFMMRYSILKSIYK